MYSNMVAASHSDSVSANRELRLLELMKRTGFRMIQENGQRKYGGPPPDWEGPPPPRGCEIFVGKIPRDLMEDELVPVFERIGPLYELRLMMDFSGSNRGFAFVMYTNREDAKRACRELNNIEVRKGHHIGVVPSVDNCRLFVGGIPRNKGRDEVKYEMERMTEGVVDVILYPAANDKSRNRGFAFVEYESHRMAAMARRKLVPGKVQLWGQVIAVDWAEPEQEVDEDTMSQVRILYVRNLMVNTTEEHLREVFDTIRPGCVERVKKIRDYAFIHFSSRQDALQAMDTFNDTQIDGATIEVVLAKPPDRSIMRYVKNVQKLTPGSMQSPQGGLVQQQIVAAAAQLANANSFNGYSDPYAADHPRTPRQSRSAAGMRSAGMKQAVTQAVRNVFQNNGYTKMNPLISDYYLPPSTNAIRFLPTNSLVSTAFLPARTGAQILDELCIQYQWGTPQYQLHTTVGKDERTGVQRQYCMYKVVIPGLSNQMGSFEYRKFSETHDEARELAAQYTLRCLGVPLINAGDFSYPPPPQHNLTAVVPAAYQATTPGLIASPVSAFPLSGNASPFNIVTTAGASPIVNHISDQLATMTFAGQDFRSQNNAPTCCTEFARAVAAAITTLPSSITSEHSLFPPVTAMVQSPSNGLYTTPAFCIQPFYPYVPQRGEYTPGASSSDTSSPTFSSPTASLPTPVQPTVAAVTGAGLRSL